MTTLPTPYYDDGQITIYHGNCLDVLIGLPEASIGAFVTSPPYNLGDNRWDMGGATPRERGVGYHSHDDSMTLEEYERWQRAVLGAMYSAADDGASLFYNHKNRTKNGNLISPLYWLRHGSVDWQVRQEIVWDRGSTHNHEPSLFWPEDERIYWMTKGKPNLPGAINQRSVWSVVPEVGNPHPAPFPVAIPTRCIRAVMSDGLSVCDPFSGSGSTMVAARLLGVRAIGIELEERYCEIAVRRLQQSVMQFNEPATRANRCTEVA